MRVRILGAHNCESASTRLATLLIDGVLALDAASLTASLTFEEQSRLKAVLLSHSHFDHARDVPTLGMNAYLGGYSFSLYATVPVLEMLSASLLTGQIYPDFTKKPSEDKPAIRLVTLEPFQEAEVAGYKVLAVPVSHSVPAAGFVVTSADGRSLFYTSDTGPGWATLVKDLHLDLIITELTSSDRFEAGMLRVGHLTPRVLKAELLSFRRLSGYLPAVVLVHMSPLIEGEIANEVAQVAREIDASITLGSEGMKMEV